MTSCPYCKEEKLDKSGYKYVDKIEVFIEIYTCTKCEQKFYGTNVNHSKEIENPKEYIQHVLNHYEKAFELFGKYRPDRYYLMEKLNATNNVFV